MLMRRFQNLNLWVGILLCLFILESGCKPKSEEEKAFDKALDYAEQSKPKEAIAEFTKAIEINPTFVDAYFNRATVYLVTHNVDAALRDLNKVIDIDPGLAPPYNARGFIYARLGQMDKAISNYTKAINLNPNFGTAYCNRAEVYYNKQEYLKSWEDVQQAASVGFECTQRFAKGLKQRGVVQNQKNNRIGKK